MKTNFIQFNYFELELPISTLESCHHQGQCDQTIKDEIETNNFVRDQLNAIDKDKLALELSDWSDWDTTNHKENKERILWLACGNWQEEQI